MRSCTPLRPSAPGSEPLRAELITDLLAADAIEAEWRSLAEARGNAFVTPEWFRAWWAEYGEGQIPAIAVARDGSGATVGVLPFARSGRGGRMLRFAGANLGDLFHPACEPGREEEVCAAAAAAILETGAQAVLLDYVPAGDGWPETLAAAEPLRFATIPQRTAELPYVPLGDAGWDGYLQTRSSSFRKRLRYLERALAKHDAAIRQVGTGDDPEQAMDLFFDLHDRRWGQRGGSSLASERARAVHHRFAASALASGWLRLRFLHLDGDPVAAFYGWRLGSRYAFYQGGFDPGWSKLSVGLHLVAQTLRSAIEEGATEFDMLLGTEGYKARFTDAAREVRSLALVRPRRPIGAILRMEAGMRRAGSRVAAGDGVAARAARKLADRLPGGRSL